MFDIYITFDKQQLEFPHNTLGRIVHFSRASIIVIDFNQTVLNSSLSVLFALFSDEPTINQTNCNVVDGIDLDEIKEFAKAFKLRRLSLGLTQTQVGQALSVTEGPAYSQSAICR